MTFALLLLIHLSFSLGFDRFVLDLGGAYYNPFPIALSETGEQLFFISPGQISSSSPFLLHFVDQFNTNVSSAVSDYSFPDLSIPDGIFASSAGTHLTAWTRGEVGVSVKDGAAILTSFDRPSVASPFSITENATISFDAIPASFFIKEGRLACMSEDFLAISAVYSTCSSCKRTGQLLIFARNVTSDPWSYSETLSLSDSSSEYMGVQLFGSACAFSRDSSLLLVSDPRRTRTVSYTRDDGEKLFSSGNSFTTSSPSRVFASGNGSIGLTLSIQQKSLTPTVGRVDYDSIYFEANPTGGAALNGPGDVFVIAFQDSERIYERYIRVYIRHSITKQWMLGHTVTLADLGFPQNNDLWSFAEHLAISWSGDITTLSSSMNGPGIIRFCTFSPSYGDVANCPRTRPSFAPTAAPTGSPTVAPTPVPPTPAPSPQPTPLPTTMAPSLPPTLAPTLEPTTPAPTAQAFCSGEEPADDAPVVEAVFAMCIDDTYASDNIGVVIADECQDRSSKFDFRLESRSSSVSCPIGGSCIMSGAEKLDENCIRSQYCVSTTPLCWRPKESESCFDFEMESCDYVQGERYCNRNPRSICEPYSKNLVKIYTNKIQIGTFFETEDMFLALKYSGAPGGAGGTVAAVIVVTALLGAMALGVFVIRKRKVVESPGVKTQQDPETPMTAVDGTSPRSGKSGRSRSQSKSQNATASPRGHRSGNRSRSHSKSGNRSRSHSRRQQKSEIEFGVSEAVATEEVAAQSLA